MNVQEIVFDKIASQKGLDPTTLNRETALLDIGLDSLDMVELAMDLEETFGMVIEQSDIAEIKNLGQAVDFVEARRKK
jgi:acyl carrier protein